MTQPFRARFTDGRGQIFLVEEVVQAPAGLTVHYVKQATGERYNCLLEAFSERFREIADD